MELVARENSTLPVRNYFGLRKDSDGKIKVKMLLFVESIINTCAKGGNTSNLLSHLTIHHLTIHGLVTIAIKAKSH